MASNAELLCEIGDLDDPGAMAVDRVIDGCPVLLARRGDEVYAYLNRCPHTGAPLDWVPGQFLDLQRRYLQCANHAALFRLEDGVCVAGPCAGDRLQSVEISLRQDQVFLGADVSGTAHWR